MPSPDAATRKPPQQARAAAKRAIILDAAERLLETQAPGALTTRGIAQAAGVPVGSVYRYFRDADDLLRQLFARMNEGTLEALETADSKGDWRRELDRIFAALSRMHAGHPAYGPLMAHLKRPEELEDPVSARVAELIARRRPDYATDLVQDITRTALATIEGVEARLHTLPGARRDAALSQARICVVAYLAQHFGESGAR